MLHLQLLGLEHHLTAFNDSHITEYKTSFLEITPPYVKVFVKRRQRSQPWGIDRTIEI